MGWARTVSYVLGDELAATLKNLVRLVDEISARPAALRVAELRGRHEFKEIDDDARRILFRHQAA